MIEYYLKGVDHQTLTDEQFYRKLGYIDYLRKLERDNNVPNG